MAVIRQTLKTEVQTVGDSLTRMGGKAFNGNRWNDCHYTNKAKQAARDAAKKGGK